MFVSHRTLLSLCCFSLTHFVCCVYCTSRHIRNLSQKLVESIILQLLTEKLNYITTSAAINTNRNLIELDYRAGIWIDLMKFNYSRWFYALRRCLYLHSLYAWLDLSSSTSRNERHTEKIAHITNLIREAFLSKCIIKTLFAPQNNRVLLYRPRGRCRRRCHRHRH